MEESGTARNADATKRRLLDAAIALFAERGFAGSSIRDLARVTGMSLAGLYHHFASKEDILYEIQHDAFSRLMAPLEHMSPDLPAEERLEIFVRNHIEFFAAHMTDMKVLSHELEALAGDHGKEIAHMRGRYYRTCLAIVTELLDQSERDDIDPAVATMALFGMINWIYRWLGTDRRHSAGGVTRQMLAIFMGGIRAGVTPYRST